MTTARLLSPRGSAGEVVFVGFRNDGMLVQQRDFIVDLGVRVPEFHEWAIERLLCGDVPYLPKPDPNDWRIRTSETGTTIFRIPEGMVYDGPSIPGAAEIISGNRNRYSACGLAHDAAFHWGMPFHAANRMFLTIALTRELCDVEPHQARACFDALELFGYAAWKADTRATPS
jgi:hypothetical protein